MRLVTPLNAFEAALTFAAVKAPAFATFFLLDETLHRLSDITRVILTPGNHDSARRLGFASDLLREGLTIRARIADVDRPIIMQRDRKSVV